MSLLWRKGWIILGVIGALWSPEADAWDGAAQAMPEVAVSVDKSRQRLFVSEGEESREYVCTTGRHLGDKRVRGDMKTPEGVYFVVGKRTSGLDFQDYGGDAYILDYPNPVDRLRGKTGSGIWLHSRGRPITPYESHGCVVVNLDDMSLLRHWLKIGTPVILAERLRHGNEAAAGETAAWVEKRTLGWHEMWRREGKAEGYCAGKDLAARMRREWEKLLRGRRPIKAETGPVRVLEGPGYWVSWFSERVLLDEGTLSGIRRLYWQEDGDGALRIVGTCWIARDGEAAPLCK